MKIEVVFACCFSCELNTTILTEQYTLFETYVQCSWMILCDFSFVLWFVFYDLLSVCGGEGVVVIVAFSFIGMLMQHHFLLLYKALFNAFGLIVAIVKLSNVAYKWQFIRLSTGSSPCPSDVTTNDKGQFQWGSVYPGEVSYTTCPNQNTPGTSASRAW